MLSCVADGRNVHPLQLQPLVALKGQAHQSTAVLHSVWIYITGFCSVLKNISSPIKHWGWANVRGPRSNDKSIYWVFAGYQAQN